MIRVLLCIVVGVLAVSPKVKADIKVTIAYLSVWKDVPPTLSNLDPVPIDQGLRGAELGLQDNATTGGFLGHNYELLRFDVQEGDDLTAIAEEALQAADFIVVNAPHDALLLVSDLDAASSKLFFNAGAADTVLRSDECRRHVLHTLPSRRMLADALAQYAVKKRWTDWALIVGSHEDDIAFANALEASAKKFKVRIRERKTWNFDADMRRSASAEVPLFTRELPEHDLLVVADEANDFARYIMFNTWLPRPLAGSEGVIPAAWHRAVEQHGAAQLQNRFRELAARPMRAIDWAAWVAVRSIGEAVTRTNKVDVESVSTFLFSDAFELAGFKGRKLSFRQWNGQLRQPVPLAHPGAVVALAPLEGFLHQFNELDTLGIDEPENRCNP